jgi:hypothetical protein
MNKRKVLLIAVFFSLLFSSFLRAEAEENNLVSAVDAIFEEEISQMDLHLKKWVDPKVVESLSGSVVKEVDIHRLYKKFRKIIVTPPQPGTYAAYGMENAEASLMRVEELGSELHNLLLGMSDMDFRKYGKLITNMRDVLLLDARYTPLAIKHDNSFDVYWYGLHSEWLNEAEKEYMNFFGPDNKTIFGKLIKKIVNR